MEEYEKSFDDILEFSKKISTLLKKKDINCIIFHTENSDGIMSANIALKFLLENKKTDIHLIPAKPSSGSGKLNYRITQHEESIKNKNILILDLQYNQEMLDYFKKHS
jgi:oligoribonuclease NrnB/cAMP/cGMP phosphodiesterase (DHH superfamily)